MKWNLRLDDWLLEQLPLAGIGRVAIPHALHILPMTRRLAYVSWMSFVSWTYLILVENGVTHPGHEHHRDQKGDEGFNCHLALYIVAISRSV
jgi:hypothetical protein